MTLRDRKQLIQLEGCAWLLGSDEIDNQFHFPFLISVRVGFIFDQRALPVGALKAAKMRVRANPVNSPGCLTLAINRARGWWL
jgi:hypothetical protein